MVSRREQTAHFPLRGCKIPGMPAAEPRYCVAQVTEETRDAWRNFCERHGIDRTAFVEVIGVWLANAPDPLPPFIEQMCKEAKDLAAERRRRG